MRAQSWAFARPAIPTIRSANRATDFSTLRYLGYQFTNLEGAVEAADAAPTIDQQTAYAKLSHTLDETIATFAAIAGPK